MLPLTLFLLFIYRHEYSVSSGKNKWLFSERFFHFLVRRVHSKNKQQLLLHFSLNLFLINLFLISAFEIHKIEALNEWIGWHITEERARIQKKTNKQTHTHTQKKILSLHKSLASFFSQRPIWILSYGSHYSESSISLLS